MKKYICLLLVLLFCPMIVHALDFPKLDSKIVEVYDLTDKELIFEINSNTKTSIASLTKIVTTMTAIENIPNLDDKVTITSDILKTVRWDASIAGLKSGDIVTYRDLLYASMLPSGADATNALAILSSGSIDSFVEKMNELVNKLGLDNTHFTNVTGLDANNHYSTADDVRKILSYSLENELFREIYTTKEYILSNGLKVNSTLKKYSISDTSKIMGSKTGFTAEAGYCLSSLSNINSHEFLIIVMNASNKNNKFYNIIDTIDLIDFLSDNYQDRVLISKTELIKTIPVKLSKIDEYEIRSLNDHRLFLPSDYDKDKIKITYDGLDELSFTNKVGEQIGTINYYYDNQLIGQDNIVLDTKLDVSIKKIFQKFYYIFIIVCVVIIYMFIKIKKKNKKKH